MLKHGTCHARKEFSDSSETRADAAVLNSWDWLRVTIAKRPRDRNDS